MHILLTNDDGINAPGINALRIELEKTQHKISVIAPNSEKSAIGHGITVREPIRVDKVDFISSSTQGWAVAGTPADCVKLAVEALLDIPPDMIISGINLGANLGTDVLYSGTVSGAMEGLINGIPSVAVSLTTYNKPEFQPAAEAVSSLLPTLQKHLPGDLLVNINIPPLPIQEIKGLQVTKLGVRKYINCIEKRTDPRGKEYYWLTGEPVNENFSAGTDAYAVEEGYISITPMHFDMTSGENLPWLANIPWNAK